VNRTGDLMDIHVIQNKLSGIVVIGMDFFCDVKM